MKRSGTAQLSTVVFNEGRYEVRFGSLVVAKFKPQDDSNAQDFSNGFNAGLKFGSAHLLSRQMGAM